ncbi:MAG: hypothetical protein CSA07_00260 [Bacteroidia bacterium]|nr:MAG: hypothetical protein CSA07_00260 [Bacteroidia bacterium]
MGGARPAAAEPGDSPARYAITVYYTAVETYHGGRRVEVRGCPSREGAFCRELLGRYPRSFVRAVRAEGTGRITSGRHAGSYLNWSHDTGYWLDTIPASSYGGRLVPFRTAAADAGVLQRGVQFRLLGPLVQDDGCPLSDTVAKRLLAARWVVQDEFTPGLGGAHHLDLYIGEEDRPNFTRESPLYMSLRGVAIRVERGGRP